MPMKFATTRPYADPEAAARKLIEIANSVEAVQDGRIQVELINGPFFVLSQRLASRIRRRAYCGPSRRLTRTSEPRRSRRIGVAILRFPIDRVVGGKEGF
jgi:hypothetical protein